MPIKIKDEVGVEHEVFTQADLDAKIEETTAALREELKPEEKPPVVTPPAPTENKEEVPAWAKELQDQVASLGGTVNSSVKEKYIGAVASGLDADRKKDVESRFNSLTGYEETPDGQMKRAQDAYMLATGEKFDSGVNMQNLNGANMGQNSTPNATTANTALDKEIQSALGVTQADVEKFTPKK